MFPDPVRRQIEAPPKTKIEVVSIFTPAQRAENSASNLMAYNVGLDLGENRVISNARGQPGKTLAGLRVLGPVICSRSSRLEQFDSWHLRRFGEARYYHHLLHVTETY
jgi:hypothetical protein